MNVLALIPARGGSKGIKMKNIQKLAGKPLIEYSIRTAKGSRFINKIVVTTDDNRIAKIARNAGAEVPFLRPKKFSSDNVPVLDVVKHALEFLAINQSYVPDMITILQPTSPLRTSKLIDRSIEMLKKTQASSVLGVSKVKTHPYGSFWYNKKYLHPFVSNFTKFYQRQKYPILYYPTGSIYTFWTKTLSEQGSIYGKKIKPIIVENENSIDIDTTIDFFIAEMIMLYWRKYEKRFSKK